MNDSKSSTNKGEGFFYRPEVIQWILRIFYSICVLLVLIDFIIHRHIVTDIERIPVFYGLYGFVACVVLVLLSNQMRKIVMRDEDYYSNKKSNEKTNQNRDAE